jgi:hypothetical protein
LIAQRNQIFRKSALEQLSSPDQLDERLSFVSYQMWIRLAAPLLGVAVALSILTYFAWYQ